MKTKSIWGNPPKRLYKLIELAEKEFGSNFNACIVGCSDGKFLMPFARKGYKVTGYDIDSIALEGGIKLFPIIENKTNYTYYKDFKSKDFKLENKKVMGIKERIEKENLTQFTDIELRDFYRDVPNKKFNIVFTSCSLHYSANKSFSLEDKVQKLQSIVTDGGYLYIDYMMAIDESNIETYPKEKFFRKGEIKNYFDNNWKILSYIENNKPSFEGAHVDCTRDHFHRFGYILAHKFNK